MNEAFVVSQLQSVSVVLAGFNFTYQANASTTMDNPTKYGLAGCIQEKFAAMLLLPASKAMTGVMQQSEAAKAERSPALVKVPDDFILFILFPVFEFVR
jgi:hypothetical protein